MDSPRPWIPVSLAFAAFATLAVAGQCVLAQTDPLPTGNRARFDALGDPLPYFAKLRLGTQRFRHPSIVTELALSPDGKTVLTIGDALIAWNAATGKVRWRQDELIAQLRLPGASYCIRPLAFTPDGNYFYTPAPPQAGRRGAASTPCILAWDAQAGTMQVLRIETKIHLANPVSEAIFKSIDVSPHADRLIALGCAFGLVVCDAQGKELYNIPNVPGPMDVERMNRDRLWFGGDYAYGRFSPDGKLLAVVTSDAQKEVKLYDAGLGQEIRRIALADALVRMEFSPDSQRLVATERDNAVRAYDVKTGDRQWEHIVKLENPYENYTSAVAFTPDGQSVAFGATDNRIRLLDAATGREQAALAGHAWYPWSLAFNRDGSLLYSAGWDGAIRRWDVPNRKQLPLPKGVRATSVVTMSPDGRQLAYADDAGTVRLVDAATGAETRQLKIDGASFSQLLFSPDGQQLAGGGALGDNVHLALWNLADGKLAHHWDWPKGKDPHSHVEALAFTPDGRRLAAAVFRQSLAYLWDIDADRLITQIAHKEIYGLSISPDGRTLATVGWDSKLRFWSAETGDAEQEIDVAQFVPGKPAEQQPQIQVWAVNNDLRMYAVSFAPVGELFATQHMNGEIWIWDRATLKPRNRITTTSIFSYGSLAFSPDGLCVATGASSGAIMLYDALTGTQLWRNHAHGDHVYTLSFGPDSRTLASGGDDGVGYLWDLHGTISTRPLTLIPRLTYLTDPAARLHAVWDALAGDDSEEAFHAFALLLKRPDEAVKLITEKLQEVDELLDPNVVDEGVPEDEAARTRRLKRQLVDKDPAIETPTAYRRAVSLLYQLRTPAARALLEQLAAKDPDSELSRVASSAVVGLAN